MLNTRRFQNKRGITAVVALAVAVGSHGQTYWTGTGSDNWNDDTSWSTGVQPTWSDDAYVGYNYGSTTFSNPGSLTLTVTGVAIANTVSSKSIIELAGSSELNISGGNLTTSSTVKIDAGGVLVLDTATIDGSVVFTGQNSAGLVEANALTIAPGSFVGGSGIGEMSEFVSLLNQGTITATGGGNLTVVTPSIVNRGTISAGNHSWITLGNEENTVLFDNTGGTISAQGGSTILLAGDLTIAKLGTIEASDTSHIYLGNLDNTGNTLDVSSWGPSGSIVLGGTLSNGKVAGTGLGFYDGIADNVEFLDAQTLTGGMGIEGNTQFDQGASIAAGGELDIEANETLAGGINLSGGRISTGSYTLTIDSATTFAASGTITGAAILNRGTILAGSQLDVLATLFLNQGMMSVTNGGWLTFQGAELQNEGMISVQGGNYGSTLVIGSLLDNTGGTISAQYGSTVYINDAKSAQLGTVTASDTSQIYLAGTIDNTANTLDVSAWGPSDSIILSGTLENGKVAGNSLALGYSQAGYVNPTVQNVEFLAAQNLDSGITLNVTDGAQFDGGLTLGSNSTLSYTNSAMLADNVTFGGDSTLNIASGTLTVGPNATLGGPGGAVITGTGNTLVNEGTILINGDEDMSVQTSRFVNRGILEVGAQRVINVSADFSQTSSGDLAFMLNSDSQFGQMNFTGTVTLDGKVNAAVLVGYLPAQGTEWDILNFTQGYSGTLTAPTGYTLIYNADSIYLEDTPITPAAFVATPEPKSVLVLAVGGLCVLLKRRRRTV